MSKIKRLLLIISLLLPLSFSAMATVSAAQPTTFCDDPNLTDQQKASCQACDNHPGLKDCLQNNGIVKDLQLVVNFLSAAVGIVVVGTIILGGIEYSMAGSSPDKVSSAKKRMMNGAIALAVFLFMFAFVQWLIPGGIFG